MVIYQILHRPILIQIKEKVIGIQLFHKENIFQICPIEY